MPPTSDDSTIPQPEPLPAWAATDDVLQAVRNATAGRYGLLPPATPDGDDAVRFVARELATGRFVGIRLVREGEGEDGDALALSVEEVPGTPPPPDATIRLTVPRGLVARAPDGTLLREVPPTVADSLACPTCGTIYPVGTRFCERDGASLLGAAVGAVHIGQVIAERYRIVRKLGEGGMGEVYLAEHVRMGSPAAIKVLRRSLMGDASSVGRFLREAQNASRVNHPNVARIFDLGETPEGLVYLAMDFVDGPTLSSVVDHDGPLSLARTASIIAQVTEAVGAAHAMGIVHRDLKPENVMLERTADGGDRVKLVDFGVAKALGNSEQHVTQAGLVVGTPLYMSPEQLAGRTIDGRSDVYAIAVMTFHLLTGQFPFAGSSWDEVVMARLIGPLRALAAVRPDQRWTPELQRVLDRGLAISADERYQTAEEFGRDLRRAADAAGASAVEAAPPPEAMAPTVITKQPLPPTRETRARDSYGRDYVAVPGGGRRMVIAGALVAAILGGAALWRRAPHRALTPSRAAAMQDSSDDEADSSDDTPDEPDSSGSAITRPRPSTTRHFDVRGALSRLAELSDPESITDSRARRVLAIVPPLLPRLVTREDSVEALYREAEARIALDDSVGGCRVLESLQRRAAGTKFSLPVTNLVGPSGLSCR